MPGAAPNFGPYGAANPFAPNFKPLVDTTATPVEKAAAPTATSTPENGSAGARGEKFASRVTGVEGKAAEGKKEEMKAAASNGMPGGRVGGGGWGGAVVCR